MFLRCGGCLKSAYGVKSCQTAFFDTNNSSNRFVGVEVAKPIREGKASGNLEYQQGWKVYIDLKGTRYFED
jgi:hypothetical protein